MKSVRLLSIQIASLLFGLIYAQDSSEETSNYTQKAEIIPAASMELEYAFKECSNMYGNAWAMMQIANDFKKAIAISNSMSYFMSNACGGPLVDSMLAVQKISNNRAAVTAPLAAAFRKAVYDNVVLGRDQAGTVWTLQYFHDKMWAYEIQPYWLAAGAYSFAILDMVDKMKGPLQDYAVKMSAAALLAALKQPGLVYSTCMQSLGIAVVDQGCKRVYPILKEFGHQAYGVQFGVQFSQSLAQYPALAACYLANGTFVRQDISPAFSVDMHTGNWPGAVSWMKAVLSGTPQGTGNESIKAQSDSNWFHMTYGLFEVAGTILAVATVQGGEIALEFIKMYEQYITTNGCASIAMALHNAEAIAQAMGVVGSFRTAISQSNTILDCVNKGLLAFQFQS